MGRGMNKFLGIQRSVGRFGATYDFVGDIVFSLLLAAIGVACIVMGIKHSPYTPSTDCSTKTKEEKCNASSCKWDEEKQKCNTKYYKAGTGAVILGVIFIALAAVSVWAGWYWRRAAYKSDAVATVGGFAFEGQLLNDIFN